jgi:hypothetical protein
MIADALADHPEGLSEDAVTAQSANLDDRQVEDFNTLVDLARRLRTTLVPVAPSVAFVHSLQRELVRNAAAHQTPARDPRRTALVAAAAVGSLISLASVVGAVAYVVTRRRAQASAQPLHASM